MDIKTDRINVVYVIGKFGIGGIETLKLCTSVLGNHRHASPYLKETILT